MKDNIDIVVEVLKEHGEYITPFSSGKYYRIDGIEFNNVATSILKALPRLDRDNVELAIFESTHATYSSYGEGIRTIDEEILISKILSLIPTDTQLKKELDELKIENKMMKLTIRDMVENPYKHSISDTAEGENDG